MKKTDKILILIASSDLGGAERQAVILAKGLSDRGYFVELWSLGNNLGNGISFIESMDINYNALEIDFLNKNLFQENVQLIKRSLIEQKISVIIPFTYWPNLYACEAYKGTEVRLCFWNQRDIGTGMTDWAQEAISIHKSTAVISNSKEGLEYLENLFDIATKRKVVIHNGTYISETCLSKKELKIKHHLKKVSFTAVMVANLNTRKDHFTLIRAWSNFINKTSSTSKLFLIGKKDETYAEVEELIIELGLQSSVEVVDFVSDVSQYLKLADIGILSTYTEGLPNSILEYMSAGLPVLATNVRGVKEVLGEGYPLLFDLGDANKLCALLISLKRNWFKRVYFGYMNKRRSQKYFSIELMVSRFENLLDENV